jgi:hypothetical protein
MSREKEQSRKIVKLSDSLHRELTSYVLAAGAAGVSVLALAPPCEGQIVYTPAHEFIDRNGMMLIDLNHDGITDVMVREVFWTYGVNGDFPGNSVQAVTRKGSGIRWRSQSRSAFPMVRGSEIGSTFRFRSGAEVMIEATNFGVYYGGSWSENATDRFLGIRFRIGEETHYGWARLSVRLGTPKHGIGVLLTGYAYEAQPDTPIRAGDTGDRDALDPTGEVFSSPKPEAKQAGLGVLALGVHGRAFFRRAQ